MANPRATWNTAVYQGETFTATFTYRDENGDVVSLAGYTAELMIRGKVYDADPPLLTLTDASGLTLGGGAGTIAWVLTPIQTAVLPLGSLAWDLKLVNGADAEILIGGSLVVKQPVTR